MEMQKAQRRWLLKSDSNYSKRKMFSVFLFLSFGLWLMNVSSAYGLTCEETCVVVIDNYRPIPPPWGVAIPKYTLTNVDHSCLSIGYTPTDVIFDKIPWFNHTVTKYYWNGVGWAGLGGMYAYTANLDLAIGADYANDLNKNRWISVNDLYPNGCSDLPSKQPDFTPNPDPGRPDCNNNGL